MRRSISTLTRPSGRHRCPNDGARHVTTRIVVADDHDAYRIGICALVRTLPNIEVVGEAANGFEVLRTMLARQAECRPYGYPDARHGWNSRDVRAFETAADD